MLVTHSVTKEIYGGRKCYQCQCPLEFEDIRFAVDTETYCPKCWDERNEQAYKRDMKLISIAFLVIVFLGTVLYFSFGPKL